MARRGCPFQLLNLDRLLCETRLLPERRPVERLDRCDTDVRVRFVTSPCLDQPLCGTRRRPERNLAALPDLSHKGHPGCVVLRHTPVRLPYDTRAQLERSPAERPRLLGMRTRA